MLSGLLMNAIVCLAISATTAAFVYMLYNKNKDRSGIINTSLKSLICFWLFVGTYFLSESVRISLFSFGIADFDKYIYLLGSILFVLIPVPLVFYIIYVITGSRQTSLAISIIIILFGTVYLATMNRSDISGPDVSFWSSVYSVNSNFSTMTLIYGLFIIPTSMIIGLMSLIFSERVSISKTNGTILSLFSISFIFDFILLNNITITGEIQMASRIFVFIGCIFGYLLHIQFDLLNLKPQALPYKGE